MREVKIDIPSKFEDDAEEVIKEYTDEISSSEIEKKDSKFIELTATISQEDLDELTDELKALDVDSGDLSIKVFEQESLIEKGASTKGASNSILSNQEIYSKAQKSATLNRAQWVMLGLAGAIAGIGLTTGNLIVLIGAILLAPLLYPLSSLSVSMAMGDSKMLASSLKSISLGTLLVALSSIPVFAIFGEAEINVLLDGLEVIALSVFVGGAAVLTFISEYKEEMAGAALAVAIVPPAVVSAEALFLQNFSKMFLGLEVLLINLLAAVLAGYLVLIGFNVKPLTDYREKLADNLKIVLFGLSILFVLFLLSAL
ncbi:MAG: TIGR00341 family protein [Candidatus Nanohaloarchaea archaeon]